MGPNISLILSFPIILPHVCRSALWEKGKKKKQATEKLYFFLKTVALNSASFPFLSFCPPLSSSLAQVSVPLYVCVCLSPYDIYN